MSVRPTWGKFASRGRRHSPVPRKGSPWAEAMRAAAETVSTRFHRPGLPCQKW